VEVSVSSAVSGETAGVPEGLDGGDDGFEGRELHVVKFV